MQTCKTLTVEKGGGEQKPPSDFSDAKKILIGIGGTLGAFFIYDWLKGR